MSDKSHDKTCENDGSGRRTCFRFVLTTSYFVFACSILSCATVPLSAKIAIDRPLRVGIIGFKVTAPVRRLSSIMDVQGKLGDKDEKALLEKVLRDVEDKTGRFLVSDLANIGKIEAVIVPEDRFDIHRGAPPDAMQMDRIRHELGVDALLYGEIPWYGRTRLIYPVLGMAADITVESILIETVLHSEELILANIGFELLTSTPLWFGGAEVFGLVFRPVTIEAHVVSANNGKEIWNKSIDRIVDTDILNSYPAADRGRKEIQLEASLKSAVRSLAESLSGKKTDGKIEHRQAE